MLGRGAVQLPQKLVRYKTWNGNPMPLPTSTPPRHIQSCKQILVYVRLVPKSLTVDQILPTPPPPPTHTHKSLLH